MLFAFSLSPYSITGVGNLNCFLEDVFDKTDIHVHVPEGAIPKDGPSAGVAMCTSIISVLTGIPVRCDVAMTGEVTLRGRVLPIGGLKEKLLAAHRGGIKKVIIPHENGKDLAEIPSNVKEGLEIILAKTVDDVIAQALVRIPHPIVWNPPPGKNILESSYEGEEDDIQRH